MSSLFDLDERKPKQSIVGRIRHPVAEPFLRRV
jgi:hypothetical protein